MRWGNWNVWNLGFLSWKNIHTDAQSEKQVYMPIVVIENF